MLRRSAVVGLALMVVGVAVPAQAQVTATVVLKNGERHVGHNAGTRVDKGEVSLRKSQSDELRVNVDQVVYIDFGGAPDAAVNLSGSQQAVVLRNGNVVRGQVIEMGHTNPADESTDFLVILRDEQGQERRFPVAQVARVYLSAPAPAVRTPMATGQLSGAGGGIIVSGQQQWTSTGLRVRRGETLRFNATGEVQLSDDANDIASPAGARSQRYAAGAPLPRELAGAIIGRINNGRPFGIGNFSSVTMPEAGVLYLGINDDHLGDNRGEFRVEIQRAGRR